MRAGPVTFGRGDALIGLEGASGIVFRIRSGWVALTRVAQPGEDEGSLLDLAMPGDLVSAEILSAVGAEVAVSLNPVSAAVAGEAVLRRLGAADPGAALWMEQQLAERRIWGDLRASGFAPGDGRRRTAVLLSRILNRLEDNKGEPIDAYLLPLSFVQMAGLVAADPPRLSETLEWLIDTRLLHCAYPTSDGIVFGVADRAGLGAIGRRGAAELARK